MEREDRLGLPGDMVDTLLKGLSLQVLATSERLLQTLPDTPVIAGGTGSWIHTVPSPCHGDWTKHNLPISREQVPGYEQEGSVLPWGGQMESAMQRREPEWE